jgi:hypothetical protein
MPKVLTFLFALLVITVPAFAGDGWIRLKPGMTKKETAAIVGLPLFSNTGHGYELWFYDHRGEVMHYRGRVLYWSTPAAPEAPTPPAASLVVPRATRPESVSTAMDQSPPGQRPVGEPESKTEPANGRT